MLSREDQRRLADQMSAAALELYFDAPAPRSRPDGSVVTEFEGLPSEFAPLAKAAELPREIRHAYQASYIRTLYAELVAGKPTPRQYWRGLARIIGQSMKWRVNLVRILAKSRV